MCSHLKTQPLMQSVLNEWRQSKPWLQLRKQSPYIKVTSLSMMIS